MCTVTYLPTRGGFTITHNRDEAPARSTFSIEEEEVKGGSKVLFPRDAKAGGTWIVAGENGKTACLLNGAFDKHQHLPPYRRSRGLMLLDFFEEPQPAVFFEQYALDGIEPFTLLFFQPGTVVEFRWDGTHRFYQQLPANKPHFWCSATLYPPDIQVKRADVFYHWLAAQPPDKAPNPSAILQLHRSGSVGDPDYDFVMQREGRVQTVSITQVVQRKKYVRMRYLDLLEGNRDERLVSERDR
jgi:Transport and Golgi organisation 2